MPPMRFMAMARVSCASLLMDPKLMAPVVKRLTISLAGSTSSSGMGSRLVLELQQAAQGAEILVLIVDQVGVLLERGGIVGPHRVLQLADGERIEQVILAALAVLIVAADNEVGFGIGERLEGVGVLELGFAGEHVEADAFNARGGAGEVGIDQRLS
jgi:hypothetical protein